MWRRNDASRSTRIRYWDPVHGLYINTRSGCVPSVLLQSDQKAYIISMRLCFLTHNGSTPSVINVINRSVKSNDESNPDPVQLHSLNEHCLPCRRHTPDAQQHDKSQRANNELNNRPPSITVRYERETALPPQQAAAD